MGDQTMNFAKKYSQNIELLATTEVGEFDGRVAEEFFDGAEELFWEQLGGAAATEVTEALGQQTYRQLDHLRRKVYTTDYELPLMLDKNHEMRTAVDFRGSYVARTVEAFKRSKSIEIFKGMFGTAYTGKNGTTATAFDYTNQLVTDADPSVTGLTKAKLISARSKLKKAGWDLKSGKHQANFVMSQHQLDDLLAVTEFTSRDYASVQALESGEKDSWIGVRFLMSQTTPYYDETLNTASLVWAENSKGVMEPTDTTSTNVRACPMYVKDAIGCYTSRNFNTEAGKIERYRYNWGLYASWSHGAVRRQEDGIVLVNCDEN